MLRELHIKDFAIIDELRLTLEPGFNILTGETGAGKSIVIDAVALLLGGRADISMIRTGATHARVEGLFVLSPAQHRAVQGVLEREELESDDPHVLWLSRELRDSGRSVARVNGRVVSLTLMREVSEGLIDIHGQSEHLSLLRVREHVNLLDRFAGLEGARAQVAHTVRQLNAVREELHALRRDERQRMQRIDMLRFQVHEIQEAQLSEDEKEHLEADLVRMTNAERIAALASGIFTLLQEGEGEVPSVLELLGQVQRDMLTLIRIDATLNAQAEVLESVGYQIDDVARVLQDYLIEVEFNPQRLAKVERRLAQLHQLERKYGKDVANILAYARDAAEELRTLEGSDERIEALEAEERTLLRQCADLCRELSQRRQAAAAEFVARVEVELEDLRMQGTRLGVDFRWHTAPNGLPMSPSLPTGSVVTSTTTESTAETVARVAFDVTGMERVEFLVAPNVGERLKPMTRVASGGETARLMLALKAVLSRADQTPTLIFDEIDQGIGGRIGAVVGAKLWQLTVGDGAANADADDTQHQVLCITHLPQLAGFGDVHFHVAKDIVEQRTVTHVWRLEGDRRLHELAQMLGTHGDAAHQGALEIMEHSRGLKAQVLDKAAS